MLLAQASLRIVRAHSSSISSGGLQVESELAETSHWLCSREVTCHTTSVAKGTSARRATEQATSSAGVCASKRGRGRGSEGWFGDIWSARAGWVVVDGGLARNGKTQENTKRCKRIKQEQARSRSRLGNGGD